MLSCLPFIHVLKRNYYYFFYTAIYYFATKVFWVFFSRPSASCSVWTTADLLQRTVPVLLVSCFCSLPKAMSSCKHLDSLSLRSARRARPCHQTRRKAGRVARPPPSPTARLGIWNAGLRARSLHPAEKVLRYPQSRV